MILSTDVRRVRFVEPWPSTGELVDYDSDVVYVVEAIEPDPEASFTVTQYFDEMREMIPTSAYLVLRPATPGEVQRWNDAQLDDEP